MAGNDGNDSKNSGCMCDRQTRFGRARPGCTGDVRAELTGPEEPTHAESSDSGRDLRRLCFAAICVLYTAIGLFTYFAYVILAIPGCILIPFAALLLTRKIRTLWNPLWLAGTAILTYATTLVSIAEAITLISSRLTLWTAIIELLTGSFTNGILFIVSMGGYSIPTIFYILYLICRAYDNRHNR